MEQLFRTFQGNEADDKKQDGVNNIRVNTHTRGSPYGLLFTAIEPRPGCMSCTSINQSWKQNAMQWDIHFTSDGDIGGTTFDSNHMLILFWTGAFAASCIAAARTEIGGDLRGHVLEHRHVKSCAIPFSRFKSLFRFQAGRTATRYLSKFFKLHSNYSLYVRTSFEADELRSLSPASSEARILDSLST